MTRNNNNEPTVRSYGRTELATFYFPKMNPEAAWHKLRSWLGLNPRLSYLYAKRTRSFTPGRGVSHLLRARRAVIRAPGS